MRKNIKKNLPVIISLAALLAGCNQSTAAPAGTTPAPTTAETTVEKTEAAASAEAETESTGAESKAPERGTGDAYSSSENDAHAIHADGETVSYDNVHVTKTGDGEGDEADFYGTNAAVFAENGAELTISNSLIETDGSHANAVFSYGEGTVLNISASDIRTTSNNSGGIMVTGGGTLNAENLNVNTQGGSSAAIRSDRGGGTITVNGGTYESYGSGSPAVYSTADITVNNASLYSDIAEAVVVEGKNSVTLNNTEAVGKNTKHNSDKSDVYKTVMIYQSMSGDAADGKGSFTMNGGSLSSLNGALFYVTNTVADINLKDVELSNESDDLLVIEGAGWGNEGSNGGQVNMTVEDQKLEGTISVDENSMLNLYMNGASSFEGAIVNPGDVYVELKDDSTWKLTANSDITALTCDEDAIDLNGFKLLVNGVEYEEGTASEGSAIEVKVSENSGHGFGGNGSENGGKGPGDGGTPPEKPDGEMPEGMPEGGQGPQDGGHGPQDGGHGPQDGGTPPEKPEGGMPGGMPGGGHGPGDGGTPPEMSESAS